MITWFQFFFRPLLRVEKCWGTIYGFQTWSRLLTSIKFLPDRFGTMGSPASPKRRGSPLRKKKLGALIFSWTIWDPFYDCKLWICLGRFPESWWVFSVRFAWCSRRFAWHFEVSQLSVFCFFAVFWVGMNFINFQIWPRPYRYNQRNDFESLILILCSSHCFATSELIHSHTQISWSMALAVSSTSKPGGQSIFHSFVATGFFLTFRKVQGYVRDPFESSV